MVTFELICYTYHRHFSQFRIIPLFNYLFTSSLGLSNKVVDIAHQLVEAIAVSMCIHGGSHSFPPKPALFWIPDRYMLGLCVIDYECSVHKRVS